MDEDTVKEVEKIIENLSNLQDRKKINMKSIITILFMIAAIWGAGISFGYTINKFNSFPDITKEAWEDVKKLPDNYNSIIRKDDSQDMSITYLTDLQLEITKEMKEVVNLINALKIDIKIHRH